MINSDLYAYYRNMLLDTLTIPSIYEQLAEECVELAHVSLKMARIIRNENPTPSDRILVSENIREEFTDILICAYLLNLTEDDNQIDYKLHRWIDRLEDNNERRGYFKEKEII